MRMPNALLTLCFGVLVTSTVQGQTNTGVNDDELNGNYAFTFSGIAARGASRPFLEQWEDSRRTEAAI